MMYAKLALLQHDHDVTARRYVDVANRFGHEKAKPVLDVMLAQAEEIARYAKLTGLKPYENLSCKLVQQAAADVARFRAGWERIRRERKRKQFEASSAFTLPAGVDLPMAGNW